METEKPPEKALQECEEKVKQLEEENQNLRDASRTFGQLAERLNVTLQQERRTTGSERRQRPRHNADRRHYRSSAMRVPPGPSHDYE